METKNEKMTEVAEKDVTQTTETTTSEKGSVEFQKLSRMAAIAAVVLAVILLVGVIVTNTTGLNQIKDSMDLELGMEKELVFDAQDYFDVDETTAEKISFDVSKVDINTVGEYEVTAVYNNKRYTINVSVVDTKAPEVKLANRYVFTNDIANLNLMTASLFENIYDASEYSAKPIRFERSGNLSVMDDKALKDLTDAINTAAKDDELKTIGTADIPTEEGVYRGVIEVADVYGNATYEEVYIILDKTGALIEDVADKTITVSTENLNIEPTVDKSEYHITDNVDGKILADNITTKLEL